MKKLTIEHMIDTKRDQRQTFEELYIVRICVSIVQNLLEFDEEIHGHVNTSNLYILDDLNVCFAQLEGEEENSLYLDEKSHHWSPEIKEGMKPTMESVSWALGYIVLNMMLLEEPLVF